MDLYAFKIYMLDFEMGYIDSFEDIMEMETGFLQSLKGR